MFSYVNPRYTWRLDKPTVFLIKNSEMWNQGQGHLHLGDQLKIQRSFIHPPSPPLLFVYHLAYQGTIFKFDISPDTIPCMQSHRQSALRARKKNVIRERLEYIDIGTFYQNHSKGGVLYLVFSSQDNCELFCFEYTQF